MPEDNSTRDDDKMGPDRHRHRDGTPRRFRRPATPEERAEADEKEARHAAATQATLQVVQELVGAERTLRNQTRSPDYALIYEVADLVHTAALWRMSEKKAEAPRRLLDILRARWPQHVSGIEERRLGELLDALKLHPGDKLRLAAVMNEGEGFQCGFCGYTCALQNDVGCQVEGCDGRRKTRALSSIVALVIYEMRALSAMIGDGDDARERTVSDVQNLVDHALAARSKRMHKK